MIRIEELKKVGSSEMGELTALMHELHEDNRTPTIAEAESIVNNTDVVVMVARDGDHIVGIATLYIIQKFGKISAHLEDVVVAEKYRGQGLGKKLVQEVIAIAKKRGVGSIALTSRPHRIAAWKLYESLGFVKRDTGVFKLSLT